MHYRVIRVQALDKGWMVTEGEMPEATFIPRLSLSLNASRNGVNNRVLSSMAAVTSA